MRDHKQDENIVQKEELKKGQKRIEEANKALSQFSINNTKITYSNFSNLLQNKIDILNKEVISLEKEIKSHKTSNAVYRFFHYSFNEYHKHEYTLKGSKWAFLTALSYYIKNQDYEEFLLNNYRTLIRAGGNESETRTLLKAAIILEKLPQMILEKFETIHDEERTKFLKEEEIVSTSKTSTSRRS